MQDRRVEHTPVVDSPIDGYARTHTEREVETPGGRVVAATPHDAAYERAVTQAPAAAVDQVQATAYDPYAGRRRASAKLVQGVWLLFGIVEGVLAVRFILKLLGANEVAGFASFIYAASGPFVAPFNNLFANPGIGAGVLELDTIVALVVYMLVAWLVAKVVWLLADESRSATRTVSSSTHARME